MSFKEVKASVNLVLKLRQAALAKIFQFENLSGKNNWVFQIQRVPRVCVLASSSRGGTAVTAELLQWQGANCINSAGRLLSLPGEEKPHLVLAGFAYPSRDEQFDDLNELDAKSINVSTLFNEIRSEIGYPMEYCGNLELYAIQLYRRLLLQWPIDLALIDINESIVRLTKALQVTFPNGYFNSLENRRKVLKVCLSCFSFIHPSFYDCRYYDAKEDLAAHLSDGCWSFEETPFVLPPPWQNATAADLEKGCLLLRDPSNAWRLPFWRAVFQRQEFEILHLVRDPRESIQGLCDGWNYPFGFQTMPSNSSLDIKGYTDNLCEGDFEWKLNRLNFSICKDLKKKLFDEKEMLSLVQVCAFQWKDAHDSIIKVCKSLKLSPRIIYFSDLRGNTEKTFKNICDSFKLEYSKSGISFAQSFNDHWVMVTPLAKLYGYNRWKTSSFSNEIIELFFSGYFDEVNIKLGLPLSNESN